MVTKLFVREMPLSSSSLILLSIGRRFIAIINVIFITFFIIIFFVIVIDFNGLIYFLWHASYRVLLITLKSIFLLFFTFL